MTATETKILNEIKQVKQELTHLKESSHFEMLTADEIASALKITKKHIYALIRSKGFPKQIKIGRSSRWRKTEVEQWIASQKNQ